MKNYLWLDPAQFQSFSVETNGHYGPSLNIELSDEQGKCLRDRLIMAFPLPAPKPGGWYPHETSTSSWCVMRDHPTGMKEWASHQIRNETLARRMADGLNSSESL